jgi:hypothetical protein
VVVSRTSPLRVANISGYWGDRLGAAREMVEGGPVDVLTGDYLAELTMLLLYKTRLRRPDEGYARTFLTQMESVLGTCLDREIKVVVNAGGTQPRRPREGPRGARRDTGVGPEDRAHRRR